MTKQISRVVLKAMLDQGVPLVLVEMLPKTAYQKHHLPGAINIPSDDILYMAPNVIPDRDAEIVVYCFNGPCKRSRLAAERLAALGYTNVRDYHEGKKDWMGAGLPLEAG